MRGEGKMPESTGEGVGCLIQRQGEGCAPTCMARHSHNQSRKQNASRLQHHAGGITGELGSAGCLTGREVTES